MAGEPPDRGHTRRETKMNTWGQGPPTSRSGSPCREAGSARPSLRRTPQLKPRIGSHSPRAAAGARQSLSEGRKATWLSENTCNPQETKENQTAA